ncbi:MAG: energy-coupling factor ABC transporter permease [Gemmataceae bacterium]
MFLILQPALFAVHLPDGVISWPWLVGGFLITGLLCVLSTQRLREEEVPRIALLAAAFFVASSIHVRLGPTSVHLLLNGLVGVILGWRAPLAILVGIVLQAVLLSHGGLTTIGINAATETLPALAAGALFPWLRSLDAGSWLRRCLVATISLLWGVLVLLAISLLKRGTLESWGQLASETPPDLSTSILQSFTAAIWNPVSLATLVILAAVGTWLDIRIGQPAEFTAGAAVGCLSVVATMLLNGMVLIGDGVERWSTFVVVVFLAHMPLALLEGFIVGVVTTYLARVKSDMLRLPSLEGVAPIAFQTSATVEPGDQVCSQVGNESNA